MQHFIVTVIETPEDAIIAAKTGVFDLFFDETECENCALVVGPVKDEFFPCVVVSNPQDETSWPICIDCAAPTILPIETVMIVEFDALNDSGDL